MKKNKIVEDKKIYIIGPSGSGKTTLAMKISEKYNIKAYELDCIVYDDKNNHSKRSDKEIDSLFNKILKSESWIIEDVGRSKFNKGLEYCDKIYYLKINKFRVYTRVIKRWINQKLGKEKYNYPPTLRQFFDMLKVARTYFKGENSKLKRIEKYKDKTVFLTNKDLNMF